MSISLPFRHLSIRVPWHVSAWNGTICPKATSNAACLCLPSIRETRDDEWEIQHAGEHVGDFSEKWPPCISERAAFMSNRPIALVLNHKLGHDELWGHLRPTQLDLPAF